MSRATFCRSLIYIWLRKMLPGKLPETYSVQNYSTTYQITCICNHSLLWCTTKAEFLAEGEGFKAMALNLTYSRREINMGISVAPVSHQKDPNFCVPTTPTTYNPSSTPSHPHLHKLYHHLTAPGSHQKNLHFCVRATLSHHHHPTHTHTHTHTTTTTTIITTPSPR